MKGLSTLFSNAVSQIVMVLSTGKVNLIVSFVVGTLIIIIVVSHIINNESYVFTQIVSTGYPGSLSAVNFKQPLTIDQEPLALEAELEPSQRTVEVAPNPKPGSCVGQTVTESYCWTVLIIVSGRGIIVGINRVVSILPNESIVTTQITSTSLPTIPLETYLIQPLGNTVQEPNMLDPVVPPEHNWEDAGNTTLFSNAVSHIIIESKVDSINLTVSDGVQGAFDLISKSLDVIQPFASVTWIVYKPTARLVIHEEIPSENDTGIVPEPWVKIIV